MTETGEMGPEPGRKKTWRPPEGVSRFRPLPQATRPTPFAQYATHYINNTIYKCPAHHPWPVRPDKPAYPNCPACRIWLASLRGEDDTDSRGLVSATEARRLRPMPRVAFRVAVQGMEKEGPFYTAMSLPSITELFEAITQYQPPFDHTGWIYRPIEGHPDTVGFHAAIMDNEDDLTAKLVYADWLEERSLPEGRAVRLDCLIRTPGSKAKQIKAAREELLVLRGIIAGTRSIFDVWDGISVRVSMRLRDLGPNRSYPQYLFRLHEQANDEAVVCPTPTRLGTVEEAMLFGAEDLDVMPSDPEEIAEALRQDGFTVSQAA